MKKYRLKISGMHCEHCVKRMEECLSSYGKVKIKLKKGEAELETETLLSFDALKQSVENCGYQLESVEEIQRKFSIF